MPRDRRERSASAFDTGIYAVSPEALLQLDVEAGQLEGESFDTKLDLILAVRRRVWLALNAGKFEPPRLPEVAAEVLRVAGDERSSARGLAHLIHQDAFLAGAVLLVANSAHYGPRGGRRITKLPEAVARLGMAQTRDVIMAVAVKQTIYRGRHRKRMRALWQAALGSAVAFNLLSGIARRNREQAFLIGLLHDVGKPVLAGMLDQILRVVPGDLEFDEVADEIFHLMHARAGAAIINGWKLPRNFAELVDHHHDPRPPPTLQEPSYYLRLSDLVYQLWLEEGEDFNKSDRLLAHSLVQRLGLPRQALYQVMALYPVALDSMMIR